MSKIRTEASPSEKVIRAVYVAAGAHLRLPDWGTTRTNEKGVTAPLPAPVSAQRVGRGQGGEASGPEVLPPLLYILIRELLYI